MYCKRTWGSGWEHEMTLQSRVPNSAPVLCFDATNGDLYCFWMGYQKANHIYYMRCISGSWAPPIDWITESEKVYDNGYLTCFYQSYDGNIGLAYVTGTSSPYKVRFAALYAPT